MSPALALLLACVCPGPPAPTVDEVLGAVRELAPVGAEASDAQRQLQAAGYACRALHGDVRVARSLDANRRVKGSDMRVDSGIVMDDYLSCTIVQSAQCTVLEWRVFVGIPGGAVSGVGASVIQLGP